MATGNAQTPTVVLNAASTTTKTAVSNFTVGSAGTRVKSVSIITGPTTAPGGTYSVTLYLYDGTNYWAFDTVVLVNTVNTIIYDEKLYPNLVVPNWSGSGTLYANVLTTLASGATVIITFNCVDL